MIKYTFSCHFFTYRTKVQKYPANIQQGKQNEMNCTKSLKPEFIACQPKAIQVGSWSIIRRNNPLKSIMRLIYQIYTKAIFQLREIISKPNAHGTLISELDENIHLTCIAILCTRQSMSGERKEERECSVRISHEPHGLLNGDIQS